MNKAACKTIKQPSVYTAILRLEGLLEFLGCDSKLLFDISGHLLLFREGLDLSRALTSFFIIKCANGAS